MVVQCTAVICKTGRGRTTLWLMSLAKSIFLSEVVFQ